MRPRELIVSTHHINPEDDIMFIELLKQNNIDYVETPAGIEVRGGSVDLPSPTILPDGVTFSNGGYVYLRGLTTLPDGVTFSNGGGVYLCSLTSEEQLYQGKTIRLRTIDGFTMLINSERQVGEYTVMSCHYFAGGDLDKLKPCYVATDGTHNAHGDTIEQAIRDLRFKIAQVDYDVDDLVSQIKERGTVTFNDFRLLTGACEAGLMHGLEEAGLSPDTEELTIEEALRAAHGPYGEAFRKLVA